MSSRLDDLERAGYLERTEQERYVLTRDGEAWFRGERFWSDKSGGPPPQRPEVRVVAELRDLVRRHPEIAGTEEIDEVLACVDALTLELRRERARSGRLRGLFRRKMLEWSMNAPQYSYDEEDTEQFLLQAEREAVEDVPDLRIVRTGGVR